ncbi:unnamed protein product [Aphanomyces euteiches]|uniref:Anaphase-promoting complex subunit 4 WD40 domain-containing protein n=1 Tax=Aphanomyces euteiches TaxID=100861 RepID=A0A6G0WB09_9STRA|nr:hypothetical protein Ae201684_016771 [Aphanomyces euteiches]KAH9075939.1 hypothetical protein Ae201684P_012429 [Aphanomyces euteiches]KAH9139911.1 hypothetical protein AeRB84_015812 [Aphanomyces euteiches]
MTNFERLLEHRERSFGLRTSRFALRNAQKKLQAHTALVNRLVCESVLKKHEGCVNRLNWNHNGSLLASGSDDNRVVIWDYSKKSARHVIETGHSMNIFGVCFIPDTNDHVVASGGMDCEVRLHYAPFRLEGSKLIATHRERVKDVVASNGVPKVFWSGAEDGLVRQFDIRMLNERYTSSNEENMPGNVLMNLGRNQGTRRLRVMGMSVHPTDPTKIALACGDHYVRLYDRRMLRPRAVHSWTSDSPTIPIEVFSPPHMHYDTACNAFTQRQHLKSHSTSVQFSSDGSQLLCSYHSDNIYLFTVGTQDVQVLDKVWRSGVHVDEICSQTSGSPFEDLELILKEAGQLVEHGQFSNAISHLQRYSKEIDAAQPSLRLRVYCLLARAYLDRNWRADAFVAMQYCLRALEIESRDSTTRTLYVKALSQSGRENLSRSEAKKVVSEFPDRSEDMQPFTTVRREAFESEDIENDIDEEEEEDEEDIEFHDEDDSAEDASSCQSEDTMAVDATADESMWESRTVNGLAHITTDIQRRYLGYCNIQTDIKEAKFFGIDDAFVVSGSDDGMAYIWEKSTGELVNALQADEDIVNCVQSHPLDLCLATSGIESVVRLWTPLAEIDVSPTQEELFRSVSQNQSQMNRREGDRINFMQNPALFRLLLQAHHEDGIQVCAPS